MPIDPNSIIDPNSAAPANSEAAPAQDTGGIPPEVLEIPLMKGLLEGAPPAVWTPIGTKGPEVETVLKNGPALNKAGFGFFRDEKEGLDVFYNSRFISPELVKAAAKKGKIKDVASPLAEVSAQIYGAVGETPGVSTPGQPPAAVAASSVTAATGLPDTPVNTARLNNVQPGSPTSGPSPGAGRILNNIIKPTI
jgi:hypothetical protein